ncbi:MAG: ABC transporter permease [Anaerolineae bacterium]
MELPVPFGKGKKASLQITGRHITLVGLFLIVLLAVASIQTWGPSMSFPENVGRSVANAVDSATKWLTREGSFIFGRISIYIKQLLAWLKIGLLWLPWPVLIATVTLLAWRMAGLRAAIFSVVSLLALGFVGLWPSAMETLALMFTSVTISIVIGIPIGIVAARSDAVDATLRPMLDGMQTMPSFVYLVPAISFFGLGNVPAVIATIIYAVPPAIRLTNLGIRQVSSETVEAAQAFGATPLQLLFKVQIPLALPTIMAGINQTTMMALAMVVIASMVGAGGLGEDVLRAIGRLEVGNSLLAGIGIVFLAIIIDRITQGFAKGRQTAEDERQS